LQAKAGGFWGKAGFSFAPTLLDTPSGSKTSRSNSRTREAAMLDSVRLPVCGADDGAALGDILFMWWEQKFLGAAESGAPAIGDRKA
jgi:hypothetical protein